MKYRIELDEEQLHILADCLDMAARMYCGQLELNTLFPLRDEISNNPNLNRLYRIEFRDSIDRSLKEVKKKIWPDLRFGDGHYGIGHNIESDHLYEMYKEIKHSFEKVREEKMGIEYSRNVHTSPPLNLTNNPKIKVYPLTTDILREENIDNILSSE